MDRRGFLVQLERATVAAVCASPGALPLILAACGGARYVKASQIGMKLALPLQEFARHESALVETPNGQLPVHVRRLAGGQFTAVLTRCMHKGCQVEPAGDRFVCPCHGSEYTLDGAVLRGPTELPLIRYRVTTDESLVYIHLDSPLTGSSS